MKLHKKGSILFVAFTLVVGSVALFAGTAFLQTKDISREKLKIYPVPDDYRNYFFLQSIGNETVIVIGDFTGSKKTDSQKTITMIIDKNSDGTIDEVLEYYPDDHLFKQRIKPSTPLFQGSMNDMKKKIVEGTVFREYYAYKMKSLDILKRKIEDGSDIRKDGEGYRVTYFDPDAPSTIMSSFFFMKKVGRYHLVFQTRYYKLFKGKITPPLEYSVYCRDSSDPYIAEVVDELLKSVR